MAEKPEDLNLPNAVIARLIKEAVGDGVNIAKEARSAISKAASVFVLYCTSCANNHALENKRKTLTAKDVIDALEEMEFGQFVKPLKENLEAFRKEQKEKKEAAAKKRKSESRPSCSGEELAGPETKKQKTDETVNEDDGDNEAENKEQNTELNDSENNEK